MTTSVFDPLTTALVTVVSSASVGGGQRAQDGTDEQQNDEFGRRHCGKMNIQRTCVDKFDEPNVKLSA
jgi:hypothetical protein